MLWILQCISILLLTSRIAFGSSLPAKRGICFSSSSASCTEDRFEPLSGSEDLQTPRNVYLVLTYNPWQKSRKSIFDMRETVRAFPSIYIVGQEGEPAMRLGFNEDSSVGLQTPAELRVTVYPAAENFKRELRAEAEVGGRVRLAVPYWTTRKKNAFFANPETGGGYYLLFWKKYEDYFRKTAQGKPKSGRNTSDRLSATAFIERFVMGSTKVNLENPFVEHLQGGFRFDYVLGQELASARAWDKDHLPGKGRLQIQELVYVTSQAIMDTSTFDPSVDSTAVRWDVSDYYNVVQIPPDPSEIQPLYRA
ncbi:MAG: hypothetical protein M1825_003422 [Sarcosagium campestre]|nr:MAG: hypothetical protein M1825_003422 [Sarcosagium campestre]